MEQTVIYLLIVQKFIISNDFSVDNMKKAGFNECAHGFSVNYDAIVVDDILDIHKYLMKKNDMV